MYKVDPMKSCSEQEVESSVRVSIFIQPFPQDFTDAPSPTLLLAALCLRKVHDHMNHLGELQASQQMEVWIHEL